MLLAGLRPADVEVVVSPLAELSAALHALTGSDHHPATRSWAEQTRSAVPAELAADIDRFTPLWSAMRWRGFYHGIEAPAPSLPDELAALATIPTSELAATIASACAGRYRGIALDRVLDDRTQQEALRTAAASLSPTRSALAESLLADVEKLRSGLLGFLDRCAHAFFAAEWQRLQPVLNVSAHTLTAALRTDGTGWSALAAFLGPTATLLEDPYRLRLDKLQQSVLRPARSGLRLTPTWFGAPHLIAKTEPGRPAVLQVPVSTPPTGITRARQRLVALTDPNRVKLCRMIAREPVSTSDLAVRLGMSAPQVSRHLRVLRDLGLVHSTRHGRFVLYSLDLRTVARLGQDVVTGLLL
jgi:DNA-binding transcriptional ArsR family regulator